LAVELPVSDQPSKRGGGAACIQSAIQTRRWNWWASDCIPTAPVDVMGHKLPSNRAGGRDEPDHCSGRSWCVSMGHTIAPQLHACLVDSSVRIRRDESAALRPPNGMPISRAAVIDRDTVRARLDAKIAAILSTRSGVGCMGGLGRALAGSIDR